MENRKFEIDPSQSKIEWEGKKVTGSHNGTIDFKKGEIVIVDGKILSGTLNVDTTSIKVLDVTDAQTNAQFAGHLASDDFFSTQDHPEALLDITAVVGKRVYGDLTIKGITHPIDFDVEFHIDQHSNLKAVAKLIVDRTKYNMKFRSGNFFTNLGDTLIYNDFTLNVALVASEVKESVIAN